MKFIVRKFQLVSKYANYLSWDEKQNAPLFKNGTIKSNMCNMKKISLSTYC